MFSRFFILILILILSFPFVLLAGTYSGGDGFFDPYQIANLDDWQELITTSDDWDCHFILTADLDLNGITYTQAPIAPDPNNLTAGFQGIMFSGSIDGQGHTISNLTINAPDQDYVALIGFLDGLNVNRGLIKDLILKNVSITGRDYTAALAAQHYNWAARIENCQVFATVSGSDRVGLISGKADSGTIDSCYTVGTAFGTIRVGGLVGQNSAAISKSASHTIVENSGSFAGGIIGHNFGTISNCYACGNVTGTARVGGLIGENQGTVSYSYAAGQVTAGSLVGGLVGSGNSADVSDSFWNTETTTQPSSQGGTPLNTEQMQNPQNFLDADWDFINETENGTDDIWTISLCTGYPTFPGLPTCNDLPQQAVPISIDDTLTGASSNATGTDLTLLGYKDNADVWYTFNCTTTDKYTITIAPQNFDSTLAVLDDEFTEIIFNDDFFNGKSAVILKASAGKEYLIRVAGLEEQTGDFTISLEQGSVQAIQGDLNYDGTVNLVDFSIFATNWLIDM
ncbi:MAG: hypothetical protein JXD22_02495 [Sedimentisphaerales bacterium]|nr:hypothetical protein [Sedimentisphaerales bacterium]